MFLLYHSDRCNTSEVVFDWCSVNDLHTTHAVVCWVTTLIIRSEPIKGATESGQWKSYYEPGECLVPKD
jgi:hypothetical protein